MESSLARQANRRIMTAKETLPQDEYEVVITSSNTSSSAWQQRYCALLNSYNIRIPNTNDSLNPPKSTCLRSQCKACQCYTRTRKEGKIFISSHQLERQSMYTKLQGYLTTYALFPLVDLRDVWPIAEQFRQQTTRVHDYGPNEAVCTVPISSRSMIILFMLAIGSICRSDPPVPALLCQVPGYDLFTGAMHILELVSMEKRSDLCILQANLAAVAFHLYLGRYDLAEETLERLRIARRHRLQQIQLGSPILSPVSSEWPCWESWILFSVAILEDGLMTYRDTESLPLPSKKMCVQVIQANAEQGYVLSSIKDLVAIQCNIDLKARSDISQVGKSVNMLQTFRQNLLPSLKWSDHDSPSEDLPSVFLRLKYYETMLYVLFGPFEMFSKLTQESKDDHEKRESQLYLLIKVFDDATDKIVNIDRNLRYLFPLRHVRLHWSPIVKALQMFRKATSTSSVRSFK